MGAHAADGAPVIVALPAEIDLTNVDRVYDLLDAAVASGAPVIVADLTGTTFCDSEGMQRLIMIHKRAACRDAQLRLAVSPGGMVWRMVEILGLDQRLPVYASAREAADLLKAPVPEPSSSYQSGMNRREPPSR